MLELVFYHSGIQHQIHYLDHFLFMVPPNTDEGAHVFEMALGVFGHLGVPVVVHKTKGPSTSLTFLGTVIDTTSLSYDFPPRRYSSSSH